MTTTFELTHEFENISLDKFEKYLNHEILNNLLEKELDFVSRKLVKTSNNKHNTSWIFEVKKKANLPSAIRNMIKSDTISWQEESLFNSKDHSISWEITPLTKGLNFVAKGIAKLSHTKNGCIRHLSGSVSVSIPLVGKLIENTIVKELVRNYDIEPNIQKKFYDSMP